MKHLPSILILSSILYLSQAEELPKSFGIPENDKIGFVFELVRHGARAPNLDDGDEFTVPTGNLT